MPIYADVRNTDDSSHSLRYDTVMECVFKTEFLTLLNAKYKEKTGREMDIVVADVIEFKLKKSGWGGGGSKTLEFKHGAAWEIKPSGKKLIVTAPVGLPADTAPSARQVVKRSTAPKASGGGGGGGGGHRKAPTASAPSGEQRAAPTRSAPPPHSSTPTSAPPPHRAPQPSQSAPNPQSAIASAIGGHGGGSRGPSAVGGGPKASPRAVRKAPAPPKPRPAPKPSLPKARAIYDYDAADVDELQLKVGDIVMITKKDASGWWQGKKAGKEGLFPGNYVEMI